MLKSSEKFPLNKITVIDFATVLAGPLVATFLGDFGAEVIKVELPGMESQFKNDAYRAIFYRNKKSITLDLHKEEGQKIAKKLCKKADVVLFNFRPGVIEKWNLGPEILHQVNPNLIICLVSAYGQTGPKSHQGGFDRTISAYTSITHTSGFPDQPPVRNGYPLLDYMTGYLGFASVMMALYNREANAGEGGEVIDICLSDVAFRATGAAMQGYLKSGEIPGRYGNRIPFVVPAENFESKDGKYIAINANSQKIWERLASAMGREDLVTSEEFGKYSKRKANQDKLYKIIGDWVKQYNTDEIVKILDEAEVPTEPVKNIAELVDDPHLLFRESILNVKDPELGKLTMPGIVPKLKNFPGSVRSLGPKLGEHTEELYQNFLGLSDEEIKDLKDKKII